MIVSDFAGFSNFADLDGFNGFEWGKGDRGEGEWGKGELGRGKRGNSERVMGK